jgi:hypothetical protein
MPTHTLCKSAVAPDQLTVKPPKLAGPYVSVRAQLIGNLKAFNIVLDPV